ncbi:MAG TPA: Y-family DNA polymerase [Piscirickettsiaceae bacterium]|nr:Y-family DNA polymerase [Piscirickettsiaceae bacterium]
MSRIVLVDANNFYASCEMVFEPALAQRPLVVLSNNDGIVVAANEPAKRLGLKGQPFFRIRQLLRRHGGVARSSNYTLYADMSRRFHRLLARHASAQEIYSIDESFLLVPEGLGAEWGRCLSDQVRQWLGLPVAVGMGRTKTEAKLANYWAKRYRLFDGVVDAAALAEAVRTVLLAQTPVSALWGVGRRLSRRLQAAGVHTVADLLSHPGDVVRRLGHLPLWRVWAELQGQRHYAVQTQPQASQTLVCSRSFARPVTALAELEAALADYVMTVMQKLWRQQLVAGEVAVFAAGSRFAQGAAVPAWAQHKLMTPTEDVVAVLKLARRLLHQLYQPGRSYRKVLIRLGALQPRHQVPAGLFSRPSRAQQALQAVQARFGPQALFLGRQGALQPQADWQMARNRRSPRYTTCWAELPQVS